MDKLTINHNAGFFSNCSIILHNIVSYFNINNKLPNIIDTSFTFNLYKNIENKDITLEYFEDYNKINTDFSNKINYHQDYQFTIYKNLDFYNISPLIKKYFTPSTQILNIIDNITNKYNIDFNNTCVLFYRGNDKATETGLSPYTYYIEIANKILIENPTIKFLIQSDETEFIELLISTFPNNSFYFKDEIRHIKSQITSVDLVYKDLNFIYSKYYLAITIIMSKCKYIVCGSGNCSIWIMLYRGNADNVYQHLNHYHSIDSIYAPYYQNAFVS